MSAPKKFVFNDPGITETPQMDFPQAFEFIKQNALDKNEHHPKCSYRQAGMLCDCSILWAEYYKRRVAALEAQVRQLREALTECEEYFDSRADADHNGDRYVGNAEMDFLVLVRAALAATEKKP